MKQDMKNRLHLDNFNSFPLQVYLCEPKLSWNPFMYTISYSSNVHNLLQCIPDLFSTQDLAYLALQFNGPNV
jgi:hypothetical protein